MSNRDQELLLMFVMLSSALLLHESRLDGGKKQDEAERKHMERVEEFKRLLMLKDSDNVS